MSVLSKIHVAMEDAETPTEVTNAHVNPGMRWIQKLTDASVSIDTIYTCLLMENCLKLSAQ